MKGSSYLCRRVPLRGQWRYVTLPLSLGSSFFLLKFMLSTSDIGSYPYSSLWYLIPILLLYIYSDSLFFFLFVVILYSLFRTSTRADSYSISTHSIPTFRVGTTFRVESSRKLYKSRKRYKSGSSKVGRIME